MKKDYSDLKKGLINELKSANQHLKNIINLKRSTFVEKAGNDKTKAKLYGDVWNRLHALPGNTMAKVNAAWYVVKAYHMQADGVPVSLKKKLKEGDVAVTCFIFKPKGLKIEGIQRKEALWGSLKNAKGEEMYFVKKSLWTENEVLTALLEWASAGFPDVTTINSACCPVKEAGNDAKKAA